MGLLIKLLAVWGLADSMWLAARPKQWSEFWGRTTGMVGENTTAAKALAGLQFAACMWILRRK